MTAVIIFFILHWYVSIFCQTFFLHRYAAHSTFTMSPFWEKFFYIFTFISQGSSYLSPYAYGIMHRMHHAYADTENDPHSPKFDKDPWHMMLRTRDIYNSIDRYQFKPDDKFMKGVPMWRSFDYFASSRITRAVWVLIYIAIYIYFQAPWFMYFLIPIHVLIGPVHGVIINWYAHRYGYRNFEVNDTSKNLIPIDLFMGGEGLHNNHHKFGGRANFAVKWWEFDPTYYVIVFLDKLGIVHIKKKDPLAYM